MKKLFVILTVFALALSFAGSAFAAGMPAAHGVDGRTFSGAVSGLAQENPAALAAHVSGNAAGMPAAHGVSGRDFGGAVSGLAQTNPAGLAAHVSGR